MAVFAPAVLCLVLLTIGAAAGSQFNYYDGSSDWPASFPNCGGSAQSPIDIDTGSVVQLCGDDAMKPNDDDLATIEFHHWGEAEGEGENKGENFEVVLSDPNTRVKLPVVDGHPYGIVQVDVCDNDVDYVYATPLQFHFHTPSENSIDGKHFPLEAHLVASIDPDDADCGYAADGSKKACLVVFSTLFDYADVPHPCVSDCFDEDLDSGAQAIDCATYGNWAVTDANGTTIQGDGSKKPLGEVKLADLLPESMDFYYWDGSLTTPPCDEIVTWIMFQEIQGVTPRQIAQLHENFDKNHMYCLFESQGSDACGNIGNMANNRPTQDLGNRTVYNSIPKDCDDTSPGGRRSADEGSFATTRL